MSVHSKKTVSAKSDARSSASLPIIIACVLVLIAFIGWVAYRNLVPPSAPDVPKSSNAVRLEKIYKESGGDLDKLSPEDRQWLHDYSHGREKEAFQYYKQYPPK